MGGQSELSGKVLGAGDPAGRELRSLFDDALSGTDHRLWWSVMPRYHTWATDDKRRSSVPHGAAARSFGASTASGTAALRLRRGVRNRQGKGADGARCPIVNHHTDSPHGGWQRDEARQGQPLFHGQIVLLGGQADLEG